MADKTPEEIEFDKAKKYGGDTRSRMKTIFGKIRDAAKDGNVEECRNLRVEFDSLAGKLPGIYDRMRRALEAFRRLTEAGVPAQVAEKTVLAPLGDGTEGFPEDGDFDPANLKVVDKNPGGTTGAKVVEIGGRKFMLKKVGKVSAEHVENEVAYNLAYREFGVWAKSGRVYRKGGETYALMEFIEDAKPLASYLRSADAEEQKRVKKELLKGYVLDALFANWDVLGSDKDNVMVAKDGRVIRIDNGSCGRYRAQGTPKKKEEWEARETIEELWSLRTSSINRGVFDGFTTEEIVETAAREMGDIERAVKRLPAADRKAIEKPLAELRELCARREKWLGTTEITKESLSLQLDGDHQLNRIEFDRACPSAVSYCDYGFCRSGGGSNVPSPPAPPSYDGTGYAQKVVAAAISINKHIKDGDFKANNVTVAAAIDLEKELKKMKCPEAQTLLGFIKSIKDSKVNGFKTVIPNVPTVSIPQDPAAAAKEQAEYQKKLDEYNRKYKSGKTPKFKSLTEMIFHAAKEMGGDPDRIADYQAGQGGDSWSPRAVKLKVLEMMSRGDDIAGAVKKGLWDGSGTSRSKKMKDAVDYYASNPAELEKDRKAFAAYKAAVVRFLEQTEVPGRDLKSRSVFLIRTESQKNVIDKYGVPKGVMCDYPISACESFACGTITSVGGNVKVLTRVPFENVITPYFLEGTPGSGDGPQWHDSEQEFSADTYGVEAYPKLVPKDQHCSFGEYLDLYDRELAKWAKDGKHTVHCY